MTKLTKRQKLVLEKVDREREYDVLEAIHLLRELKSDKFKESVDVAINLSLDPRQADQNLRGTTVLPNGSGKNVRVAVFAEGERAEAAKAAGAELVGGADLVAKIQDGELDFDVVISTPDMMRTVAPLGRILGPRGLMPNPKSGTVTVDTEVAVQNAKSGQIQYRTDRGGVIHGSIGQIDQEPTQLKENFEALLTDLKKAKPASAKGTYVRKITLSTTMGPGLLIEESSIGVA